MDRDPHSIRALSLVAESSCLSRRCRLLYRGSGNHLTDSGISTGRFWNPSRDLKRGMRRVVSWTCGTPRGRGLLGFLQVTVGFSMTSRYVNTKMFSTGEQPLSG